MNETHVAVDPRTEPCLPPSPVPESPVAANPCAPAVPAESPVELRLRRIDDYLATTLQSPLAEVAMLGGVNADLAKLAMRLNQSLEGVLGICPRGGEDDEALYEGVTMFLKVTRQLERGTRLTNELSRSQQRSEASPQRRPMASLSPADCSSENARRPQTTRSASGKSISPSQCPPAGSYSAPHHSGFSIRLSVSYSHQRRVRCCARCGQMIVTGAAASQNSHPSP